MEPVAKKREFVLEGAGAGDEFANEMGEAGRSHINTIDPMTNGSEKIRPREG